MLRKSGFITKKKNSFFTISCCNFTPLRWALRSPRILHIATIYFLWFNCPCSHSSHTAFYKSPPISSIYPHDSSVMKFAEEGQKVRNLHPRLNVATFISYNAVKKKKEKTPKNKWTNYNGTKQTGSSTKTSGLYSGEAQFLSRPRQSSSWQKCFAVFFDFSRDIPLEYLKLCRNHFFLQSCLFIIHTYHPTLRYYILVKSGVDTLSHTT